MENVLQSKIIYHITLGKEIAPIFTSNKSKWDNKNDESHELIEMSIFSDLWFHIQRVEKLDDTWKKMTTVFGKHCEIQSQ
jgi:hypothetical protein